MYQASLNNCELAQKLLIRVICALIIFGISSIPIIILGLDGMGNIYVNQIFVYIIPLLFCSFCMMTVYDKVVYAINDRFGYNE